MQYRATAFSPISEMSRTEVETLRRGEKRGPMTDLEEGTSTMGDRHQQERAEAPREREESHGYERRISESILLPLVTQGHFMNSNDLAFSPSTSFSPDHAAYGQPFGLAYLNGQSGETLVPSSIGRGGGIVVNGRSETMSVVDEDPAPPYSARGSSNGMRTCNGLEIRTI